MAQAVRGSSVPSTSKYLTLRSFSLKEISEGNLMRAEYCGGERGGREGGRNGEREGGREGNG